MTQYLVVGASGYIGSAVYKRLVEAEEKVVGTTCHGRSKTDFCDLDLADTQSTELFVRKFLPQVDVLNGVVFANSFGDEKHFDSSLEHRYEQYQDLGPFAYNVNYLIHALKSRLTAAQNPNIVFLSSLVGSKATPAPISFSLAKSMVNGFTESLSKHLGSENIKVNSVAPGMLEGGASKLVCEKNKKKYLEHCALGRFGTNEEVAKTVCWLLVDNSYITGQKIVLDGAL